MNVKPMMEIRRTIYCIDSCSISYYKKQNNVHLYSLRNTFPYLTTIVFERHGNITMIRVSSFLFDGYDDKTSRQNLSDYVITGHPPSKAICLEQMREILSLNNKN